MMFLLTALVAAAPLGSVLILPISARGDVSSDLAALVTERVVTRITKSNRFDKVVSERDVAAVLDVEQQKALLGCDDLSCAAERAGALGTDYVVTGSVGRVGSLHVVTLRLARSRTGELLAAVSRNVASADEGDVLLAVDDVLHEALRDAFGEAEARGGGDAWFWLPPVAVGAGAQLVAVTLMLLGVPWLVVGAVETAPTGDNPLAFATASCATASCGILLAGLTPVGWLASGVVLALTHRGRFVTRDRVMLGVLAAVSALVTVSSVLGFGLGWVVLVGDFLTTPGMQSVQTLALQSVGFGLLGTSTVAVFMGAGGLLAALAFTAEGVRRELSVLQELEEARER